MAQMHLLKKNVETLLGSDLLLLDCQYNELIAVVDPSNITEIMIKLRSDQSTLFEQCIDLCGVDYSTYHDDYVGKRFAVIYHLLSMTHNWRLRVKTFLADDKFPLINSIVEVYNGVNWFEREAFDLYGIIFENHPDLRRILTDYGFVGHPFRKDFPISGFMEMRYDETQKRVVYQKVTIEPREITPRIIREDNYGGRVNNKRD